MMTEKIRSLPHLFTFKGMVYLFLFFYFGSMIVPQWSIFYSSHFLDWFIALPIVVLALVLAGIWGGIGLWQAKLKNVPQKQRYSYFVRLASISLLWFGLSVALTYGTQYAYLHKKFDSGVWKAKASIGHVPYESPSLRQRMVNDVVENLLPRSTKSEIELLLGEPDEAWIVDNTEYTLYVIGNERGFGVDSECLTIEYDVQGHFQSYEVFGNCG